MEIPFVDIPPSAPHTHTVVFLHGRGDNARNFSASFAHSRNSQGHTLMQALPSFRWVFPQAPTRKCASSPDVWPQWFDVWNVGDLSENEDLQAVGLKEVVPAISQIIAREALLLEGRYDRIVLAGISMGGATSVHTLFNLGIPATGAGSRRLGALLGFSCRCPFIGRTLEQMRMTLGLGNHAALSDDVLRNTPMLLEHCVDDPLVLVQQGRALRDTLRGFGAQVVWKEYPSGEHWFNSPAGMDDVVEFLKVHLGTGSAGAVSNPPRLHDPSGMDLS